MSFMLSFTKYKIISTPKWFGFGNFIEMYQDENFWTAARVNLEYVIITVPLRMVFALFIAYVLTSNVKGIGVFRSIYYIPSLMGGNVAIAILWRFLFLQDGLINAILKIFGFPPYPFLTKDLSALFVVSLLHVWQFGATMVIFLSALKGVPRSLYEAAIVDGASRGRIFFSITIPYISPVIFFNLMTNMVTACQEFNSPYMVTQGGTRKSYDIDESDYLQQCLQIHEAGVCECTFFSAVPHHCLNHACFVCNQQTLGELSGLRRKI